MKVKMLSWGIYAFLILISGGVFLQELNAKTTAKEKDEDYVFEGTWDPGRRSIVFDPITGCTINDNIVCVHFKFTSPDVIISIQKEGVAVEQIELSAPAGHSEYINLAPYGTGEYRIDIFDIRGNHIWSNFTIK